MIHGNRSLLVSGTSSSSLCQNKRSHFMAAGPRQQLLPATGKIGQIIGFKSLHARHVPQKRMKQHGGDRHRHNHLLGSTWQERFDKVIHPTSTASVHGNLISLKSHHGQNAAMSTQSICKRRRLWAIYPRVKFLASDLHIVSCSPCFWTEFICLPSRF